MKSLTKENFWNELQTACPVAMQYFCDWIDKYKLDNDWENLFSNYIKKGFGKPEIKFHDIPIAMQMGILLEYFMETADLTIFGKEVETPADMTEIIKQFFTADEKRRKEEPPKQVEGKYIDKNTVIKIIEDKIQIAGDPLQQKELKEILEQIKTTF